jgi:oxygen-independent coproporphyrinogen-3 oxidase
MIPQTTIDLFSKYAKSGPRYTSYPTAPAFAPVSQQDIITQFALHHDDDAPLSVYVHIPFCQSLCWYCGCTTVITRNNGQADIYLDYLERELELRTQYQNFDRKVEQMHWGGGTPTFLSPDQIRRLGNTLNSFFTFTDDAEIRVEIDPRTADESHIKALRDIGFNQASIGVQDTHDDVQKAIHRVQSMDENRQIMDWLRKYDFTALNVDLIYGLPLQNDEKFQETIDDVLTLDPDRLALFNYAHVPWMKPSQKLLQVDDMPGTDEKIQILLNAHHRLTKEGFHAIGLDHFAKPDDALSVAHKQGKLQRNFQGYSTQDGVEILGLGMSSISQAPWGYYQNEKSLPDYKHMIENGELPIIKSYELDRDDHIRRHTIMRLMCDMQLKWDEIDAEFCINSRKYFSEEIEQLTPFEKDGLITIDENGFYCTTFGQLLVRNIAMLFDAHLQKMREQRFSKTV